MILTLWIYTAPKGNTIRCRFCAAYKTYFMGPYVNALTQYCVYLLPRQKGKVNAITSCNLSVRIFIAKSYDTPGSNTFQRKLMIIHR